MKQSFIVEETSFDGKTWVERQRAPWPSSTFDYSFLFHSRTRDVQFLGENARYIRARIEEVEVSDPVPPEPKTEFVGHFRWLGNELSFENLDGEWEEIPADCKVRVIVESGT